MVSLTWRSPLSSKNHVGLKNHGTPGHSGSAPRAQPGLACSGSVRAPDLCPASPRMPEPPHLLENSPSFRTHPWASHAPGRNFLGSAPGETVIPHPHLENGLRVQIGPRSLGQEEKIGRQQNHHVMVQQEEQELWKQKDSQISPPLFTS